MATRKDVAPLSQGDDVTWTDSDLIACFRMPSGLTISGRSSTMVNAFVNAVVPFVLPSPSEIAHVLRILGMEPSDVRCAYCGDKATESDHLYPLVREGSPTGYITSIRNLVPACGKCNQSKGGRPWKEWMQGTARLSPRSRGIPDVEARIARLEAYEEWAQPVPIPLDTLADAELWERYTSLRQQLLTSMSEAQILANTIRGQVLSRWVRPNDGRYEIDRASDNPRVDLIRYLQTAGLSAVDKRTQGGRLWVEGDEQLRPMLDALSRYGIDFHFAPAGGSAIGGRPGWWTAWTDT